jgi:hypothetical protein
MARREDLDKLDRIEKSLNELIGKIEALSVEVNKLKTQTSSRTRRKTNE